MNIGIITQSYYPIHGGVAQHVHFEATELIKRGHNVTVITAYFNRRDENYSYPFVERIGMDVTLPFNGAFVNFTVGSNLAGDLRRIEEERKFDVVHIHQPMDPVLPLIALKVIRAPKVGTFHSYKDAAKLYNVFRPKLRSYFNRLSGRIAVSEAARHFISGYFPGEYAIIPNGVAAERFRPDVEKLPQYDDDVFTILFVGRMDPRKGVRHLLAAYGKLKPTLPRSRLVIVGGGILKEYYRRFRVPDSVPDVQFVGYVSDDLLPRYYASCDVYCSPVTGGESFGIVLLEGMASGKVVIGSDVGGYRYVIQNEQNGLLTPPGDSDALARTILRAAREQGLRLHLEKNARETALLYDWPVVVGRIEQELIRAANGNERSI